MNINSFNSKINLPELALSVLGKSEYQFVKLPVFGWFAFNSDRSVCAAVYDLIKPSAGISLYRYLTADRPEFQDFKFGYSECAENRFMADYEEYLIWRNIWKMARGEAVTEKLYYKAKYTKLVPDIAEDVGYPHLLDAGLGLITDRLMEQKMFSRVKWPAGIRNKILIPTFCTPAHICSLEVASIYNLNDRSLVWQNGEKGWYGDIRGPLVADLKTACAVGGFTWDPKADYWTNQIVELSPDLPVAECLHLWTEAKRTKFNVSPLDIIATSGKLAEVKNHVASLNYDQIGELERKLETPLTEYWKQIREKEIDIGNLKFIKRKNCYYLHLRGHTQEFSNFIVDVTRIVKRGGKYFRQGHIFSKDQVLPFEFPEAAFNSCRSINKALRVFFFDAGLGLPLLLTNYSHYLLDVINKFSPDPEVVVEASLASPAAVPLVK